MGSMQACLLGILECPGKFLLFTYIKDFEQKIFWFCLKYRYPVVLTKINRQSTNSICLTMFLRLCFHPLSKEYGVSYHYSERQYLFVRLTSINLVMLLSHMVKFGEISGHCSRLSLAC